MIPIEKVKLIVDTYNNLEKALTSGNIDKSKVMIIPFDRMMSDFETLMNEILEFIGHSPSEKLKKNILATAEKQRSFESKHKYDLDKFGLTVEQIQSDCAPIYETFINSRNRN